MDLARAEQETTIRWDENEPIACAVCSASPKTWRKRARLGVRPVKETAFRDGAPSGKFYRVPLARLRWRALPEGPRPRGNPAAFRTAQEARRPRVETEIPGLGAAGQGGDSPPGASPAGTS
jgi:hypothetical protein